MSDEIPKIKHPELSQAKSEPHRHENVLLHYSKKILHMAVPIIGARTINMLNVFLSMLIVAHLGHAALAASSLISSVMMTVMTIAWSLLFGIGVLVGHMFGAEKLREAGGVIRESLWLGIFIGIPTSLLLWNFGPVLLYFGQEPRLVALASVYFKAAAWGVVPSMWSFCFMQFFVGISKPKLITLWSIIGLPLVVIPGYILAFGRFGLPVLGMAGVSYAGSVTNWIMFIIVAAYLFYRKEYQKYQIFILHGWFSFKHLKELLSFGWFVSLQVGAELIAFAVSTIWIGWLGEAPLAAHQIVLQISIVLLMIPFGISQVSAVLIGQSFGRKHWHAIRNIGNTALFWGGVSGFLFIILYCVFPKVVISFYLDPNAKETIKTVQLATWLLAVGSVAQLFDILRTVASGALRGLFDTKVPMFVSVFISCLTSLPIGYILGFYLHWGVVGIRLGFVIGFGWGAIILMRRFYRMSDPVLLAKEMK